MCQSACPERAIETVDGSVRVDPSKCNGCMLCVAACPTETLQSPRGDFLQVLEELSESNEPVLGCSSQESARGHGRVECLGQLGMEHWIALRVFVRGTLIVNATACSSCPRRAALEPVRQEVESVARLQLGEGAADLRMMEDPRGVEYRPTVGDRRWLFRSLERRIARRLSDSLDRRPTTESAGAVKTCPERTRFLAAALERLPSDWRDAAKRACLPRIRLTETCNDCGRCASICPTGALAKKIQGGERSLATTPTRCNACGICVSFCSRNGIEVEPGRIQQDEERLGIQTR
ncbi:MAG: 4Fe-4S dicluster domain-containing protein [Nitrospirae bacterium]|nr:4Fe-4S dicluster domain-containing protein [Nitrospirota bacterium]